MFHEWIAEELEKIKEGDLVEPDYVLNPDTDHVLGEMSEKLKKLFTLWHKTGQATKAAMKAYTVGVKKIIIEFPEEPNQVDLDKAQKMVRQLQRSIILAKDREEAVGEAFWISVGDEFPETNDKPPVVCKGFKVALTEIEERPMLQATTMGAIIQELLSR